MKKYLLIFIVQLFSILCTFSSTVINVSSYGAIPNDDIDDTGAIQKAIDACKINATLVFDVGEYHVSGKSVYGVCLNLCEISNYVIEGNGATIITTSDYNVSTIKVANSKNVIINNLFFDELTQTHGGGIVINRGENYTDVKIEYPYMPRKTRVEAILSYDLDSMRLSLSGYDHYQLDTKFDSEIIDENTMRVYYENTNIIPPVGQPIVMRYKVYGSHCIYVDNSEDILIHNTQIYSVSGFGYYFTNSKDLILDNCSVKIKPGSGRWLSTNADASHFINTRGFIKLTNCTFENMGDDGINVQNFYMKVNRILSKRRFLLHFPTWKYTLPQIGDTLEVGTTLHGMIPSDTILVKSVTALPDNYAEVETEKDCPSSMAEGDIVGNVSCSPSLYVGNCIVRNNRARGILIQTRNVLVENSLFDHCSSAGIHITSDVGPWNEGLSCRNVTIKNNKFIGTNFGAASSEATLNVFAQNENFQMETLPVHKRIVIANNYFDGNKRCCINLIGVDSVIIENNTIAHFDKPFLKCHDESTRVIVANTITKKALYVTPVELPEMSTELNVPLRSEKIKLSVLNLSEPIHLSIQGDDADAFSPSTTIISPSQYLRPFSIIYSPNTIGIHTAELILSSSELTVRYPLKGSTSNISSLGNNANNTINIYSSFHKIIIESMEDCTLEIYTLSGALLYHEYFNCGLHCLDFPLNHIIGLVKLKTPTQSIQKILYMD